MTYLHALFEWLNGLVWGLPMIGLILGTGIYLQLQLGFMPLRKIALGFRMVAGSQTEGSPKDGEISPFAALMTALSATVGTGNIVGVAAAIAVGGPGAMFWMWMTALLGMATKYGEVVLAVQYREVAPNGQHLGGPMYVIKHGLGVRWGWLATAFGLFGGLAGFGIGNLVQANGIASALHNAFGIPDVWTGLVLAVLTGAVILGGIQRIGAVAEWLVPAMCLAYMASVAWILWVFADRIPQAFVLIFQHAFSPAAATGGFVGATVLLAMQQGVARGIFSNEAGLGTAGIAQAAGASRDPVYSGLIGMMGTFIDTIVICSCTGLALIVSGVWDSGGNGAVLTASAFELAMPGMGKYLLALLLAVFAFTTILGWSYYGEKCWEFLVGPRSRTPFRWLWTLAVLPGAVLKLEIVWLVADTLNALMAIPNLLALLLLSPVIVRLSRDYFASGSLPTLR